MKSQQKNQPRNKLNNTNSKRTKKKMKMMMVGKSKRKSRFSSKYNLQQTMFNSNKISRFIRSSLNQDLKPFRILAMLSKRDRTKMSIIPQLRNLKVKLAQILRILLKLQEKLLNPNGQVKNGLRNGKKPCSCQTSRPAYLTHTTRQWPLGTN